ncbi:MAG: tetratricopeptide repeat protein, partial [Pseudomonadales bacterium]
MTSPWKYRAFLSYSHRDSRWATWLHRKLEGYTVPKGLLGQPTEFGPVPERIAPIFRDREEFASKADLGAAVEHALSQALFLVVICSPDSAQSRWVDEEVARFKRLGNPDNILCLLVGGDPGAAPGSEQDCFVPSLRTRTDANGNAVAVEPLAADVRNSGDGKRSALLKLAASILGVEYDQLHQREAARRQRRMAIITGASLAGALVTTGLAISAVLARQEAEQQRNIAQVEAETANRTTEFMVDLFTVSDPGENRGNTITAKEILERGRARVGIELADQPRIRSRLMLTMGRVYTGLGLYDTAEQILADAQATPAPGQSPEELLRIEVALGSAEYLLGNYEDARARLAGALELARENTLPWSRIRSDAHLQYGAALVEFDALEEAEGHYRLALQADQSAWGNDDAQVGKGHNGLGMVLLFQGRLEESGTQFTTAHRVLRGSLGVDHPLTVEALTNVATNYYFSRDFKSAHTTLQTLVPMYRRLLGDQHPELATVLNNLGRTYLELGELSEAR